MPITHSAFGVQDVDGPPEGASDTRKEAFALNRFPLLLQETTPGCRQGTALEQTNLLCFRPLQLNLTASLSCSTRLARGGQPALHNPTCSFHFRPPDRPACRKMRGKEGEKWLNGQVRPQTLTTRGLGLVWNARLHSLGTLIKGLGWSHGGSDKRPLGTKYLGVRENSGPVPAWPLTIGMTPAGSKILLAPAVPSVGVTEASSGSSPFCTAHTKPPPRNHQLFLITVMGQGLISQKREKQDLQDLVPESPQTRRKPPAEVSLEPPGHGARGWRFQQHRPSESLHRMAGPGSVTVSGMVIKWGVGVRFLQTVKTQVN